MRLRMIPLGLTLLFAGGSLAAGSLVPGSLVPGSLAGAQPQAPERHDDTKSQVVCTMIYKPVCGRDKDGKQRTFSNECIAKAAGVTNIYPGPCIADITNQ